MSVPTPLGSCPREPELLDALGRGFVGPDLETHAAGCPECGETYAVASAFLDDRAAAVAEAPVPASGTMWWRMRIRQRRDAEERARRSLLVGQAATLSIALALVLALFGAEIVSGLRAMAAAVRVSTPLLVALGTLLAALVIAPVAGWLALRERKGGRA